MINRNADDHDFNFTDDVCKKCKKTWVQYLEEGCPKCSGKPEEPPTRFFIEEDQE